jgi:hypothetical protein
MRSERLITLVTPEEKDRYARFAEAEGVPLGELVRRALSFWTDRHARDPESRRAPAPSERGLNGDEGSTGGVAGEAVVSPAEARTIERLADVALDRLRRADAALDWAEREIATTRRYFADKGEHRNRGEVGG